MENNQSSLTLDVGMVIKMKQLIYRILCVKQGIVTLCEMNTSKLHFNSVPAKDLLIQIGEKQVEVISMPESKPIDIAQLSPSMQEGYSQKLSFIHKIKEHYAPMYLGLKDPDDKNVLNESIAESNYSRPTALKFIRTYLQSGEDPCALLDGRISQKRTAPNQVHRKKKTGKPTEEGKVLTNQDLQNMQEAMDNYKSNSHVTIRSAYIAMLNQHYSTSKETETGVQLIHFPPNEYPTERQFRYFISKNLSKEELDHGKKGTQVQRNNNRVLRGDNLHNVNGPGDLCEIDEIEADISVVSEIDHTQTVGRPIVYFIIDVFSRMIIAFSVAFDNNSTVGMTNCLLSLLDDKAELCKKLGIPLNDGQWPFGILPNRIRCDYGSEYRSKAASEIFSSLGIVRELVSPGEGSLKGQIEQSFRQMQAAHNPLLGGKGLMEKEHGSKHHEKAVLTIREYEALVIEFIVSHNRQHMKDYPLSPNMIAKRIFPTPCNIWAYGCSQFGSPKKIANKVQFLFSLLTPVSAQISRRGIIYNGLFYLNENDPNLMSKIYNCGSKTLKFECRIDTRDIGVLYYIDDNGNLARAPLNLNRTGNDYRGYTLAEYQIILKIKKEINAPGKNYEVQRKGELYSRQKAIVQEASKKPKVANKTKGMREARNFEKNLREQDFLVSKHLPPLISEHSESQDSSVQIEDPQINDFLADLETAKKSGGDL